jgi:hypothetical protein
MPLIGRPHRVNIGVMGLKYRLTRLHLRQIGQVARERRTLCSQDRRHTMPARLPIVVRSRH